MKFKNDFYLPSGRIFLLEDDSGYPIECTEMRDVSVDSKNHSEVRETQDPHVVWRHLVPYDKKWLLTVSTQKGCVHNCRFCDVPRLPFKGNLTRNEILDQVDTILRASPFVKYSDKVKIGFARMGEPAHNLENVLSAMQALPEISRGYGRDFKWLPCFNSILPRKAESIDVINEVIYFKEKEYNGRLHFQISCNSTDENVRRELFGGADVLDLEEIINNVKKNDITSRTVTLNFIVMKDVPIDVKKLKKMGLSSDKFAVKLIPLNDTENAKDYDLETYANYSNYDDLINLKKEFEDEGIPVVVDAIAKCEEAGLCCGQIANIHV